MVWMLDTFHYKVSTPKNLKYDEEYPVLIALHGIGYNEKHMMSLFEELANTFIVIGVRGDLPYEDGFAYYYLKNYGNPDRALFEKSMEKLQSFISFILEEYPVNREHVYLAGFSQGAILCNSLALVLGEKVRGIVSMSGYVPEFLRDKYRIQPIDHMDILLTDGEDDPIFPPEIGQKNYEFFKDKGRTVVYKTYPQGHEIGKNNETDVVKWLLTNYQWTNK